MLFGVAAWAVLFGFYLLFAGQTSATELAAGLPASGAAAAFVVVLRRRETRGLRVGWPWWPIVARPLAALAPDAARVGRELLRALRRRPPEALGAIARQPFRESGETPADSARRGLVSLAASFAPNGYVLSLPHGGDAILLHRLVVVPPDPDREWPL